MKTFKIESWDVGGSCGSYWNEYIVTAKTLEEAKQILVKQVGCTKNYFDDEEYNKITVIKTEL